MRMIANATKTLLLVEKLFLAGRSGCYLLLIVLAAA
jgi:hypothetical protein